MNTIKFVFILSFAFNTASLAQDDKEKKPEPPKQEKPSKPKDPLEDLKDLKDPNKDPEPEGGGSIRA